jgi:prephenate dehydrogenase
MKTVCIVGYGRFGTLLASLMRREFAVSICEDNPESAARVIADALPRVMLNEIGRFDIVMFAVPISSLESVIKDAAAYVSEGQLVMDVCSVKVYPAQLMKKYLQGCQILATHPMFGPDSASKGLDGLQLALCPISVDDETVQTIADFWQRKAVEVLITSPERHDRDVVYSLAFTHSVARIILGMNAPDIMLTTRNFNAVTEVARLAAKDTDQLFHDMLFYNPFFKQMKQELEASTSSLCARLDEIEQEQDRLLG